MPPAARRPPGVPRPLAEPHVASEVRGLSEPAGRSAGPPGPAGALPPDATEVVGAGAVGLSAILTVGLWGASKVIAVDSNKFRLEKAQEFGATDVLEAVRTRLPTSSR